MQGGFMLEADRVRSKRKTTPHVKDKAARRPQQPRGSVARIKSQALTQAHPLSLWKSPTYSSRSQNNAKQGRQYTADYQT